MAQTLRRASLTTFSLTILYGTFGHHRGIISRMDRRSAWCKNLSPFWIRNLSAQAIRRLISQVFVCITTRRPLQMGQFRVVSSSNKHYAHVCLRSAQKRIFDSNRHLSLLGQSIANHSLRHYSRDMEVTLSLTAAIDSFTNLTLSLVMKPTTRNQRQLIQRLTIN